MLNFSNNSGTTSPSVNGCLFYENSSANGGSIANSTYSSGVNTMVVTNSTFADNTGGASIYNKHGHASIIIQNSILWENTPLYNKGTETTLRYSIIKGNVLPVGTTNGGSILLNINPNFSNAAADDYSVTILSQAVDGGLDSYLPTGYDSDLNGGTRINGSFVDMGAIEAAASAVTRIYVDKDATSGGNDGTSWADAFTSLKSATDLAGAGVEIWVADGTYYPATSDRSASFAVLNGVKVYGGFNGTETQLTQRDWNTNATILSGDIGTMGNSSDNSYHVVSLLGVSATTVFDGLIIQEGNANNGTYPNDRGAGVYNDGINGGNSSPTFQNCIFRWNNALTMGGAMLNIANGGGTTSPILNGCLFYENSSAQGASILNATFSGGANAMIITNCTFADNGANSSINNKHSNANITIQNSILWDNSPLVNGGNEATLSYSIIKEGSLPTGTTDGGNNQLNADPLFANAAGDDYSLTNFSPALNIGSNVLLDAGYTKDLLAGDRVFNTTVDLGAIEATVTNSTQIYVDKDATGANDGTSWTNAFTSLKDATDLASSGVEVWVADGTYYPTSGTDRTTSFVVNSGAKIYGGFNGTETQLTQRIGIQM